MANEIVIYELRDIPAGNHSSLFSNPVTTQYVDYGALSSEFNADTRAIRVKNVGLTTAFYKLGDSSVSAAANTAGNMVLAAGEVEDIWIGRGLRYLDNATA